MKNLIRSFVFIFLIVITTSCVGSIDNSTADASSKITFENGDLMTNATADPMGNALVYPAGKASITSQVKVWAPGFTSPWHYHPYQSIAHILQGELTVNFDAEAPLDNTSNSKSTSITKTFKPGDTFIGTANTWHFSENLGDEDLIFMVSWLAEEGAPIAVLADKE